MILIVIIGFGISCLVIPGLRNDIAWFNISSENIFIGTKSNPNAYVSAIIAAFWAYSGYDATCDIAEEIKDPLKRNILGAAVTSILNVTAIYILANLSYFLLLSPTEILSSEAVAVTFGAKFSLAFGLVIKAFVCLSILGSMNITMVNASRYILSAARRGHLPAQLSLISIQR